MFLPNQKIVCIDGNFSPNAAQYYPSLPVKDQTYTVRDVVPGISLTGSEGEVAVYLCEIQGSVNSHNIERGFNAERFAPLNPLVEDEIEEFAKRSGELAAV